MLLHLFKWVSTDGNIGREQGGLLRTASDATHIQPDASRSGVVVVPVLPRDADFRRCVTGGRPTRCGSIDFVGEV